MLCRVLNTTLASLYRNASRHWFFLNKSMIVSAFCFSFVNLISWSMLISTNIYLFKLKKKHQKKVWNMFKVNNKSPKFTPFSSVSIVHNIYEAGDFCENSIAKNTVISPNFLAWKVCGKAQFPHSFRWIAQNFTETEHFHKISTPEN